MTDRSASSGAPEAKRATGKGTRLVAALLVLQLIIFLSSLNPALMTVSIFCTATHNPSLEAFGWVHFALAGLFGLGAFSLLYAPLRRPYAILVILALAALPVQAWLVQQGRLYCDVP